MEHQQYEYAFISLKVSHLVYENTDALAFALQIVNTKISNKHSKEAGTNQTNFVDIASLHKCKKDRSLPPSLLTKELIEPISKAANKARTLKQSVLKEHAS